MRDAPRRRAGIRLRVVAVAAAVVAVALVAGGAASIVILRNTMIANVDAAIGLRADDITVAAANGDLPSLVAGGIDDETVAQVVDGTGRVVAQSNGVRGLLASTVGPIPLGRDTIRTVAHPPMGDGAAYRVLARRVQTADGPLTVLVGGSLEPTDESVDAMRTILLVGIPAIVAVVGALAWWLVGRTLRPVEAMRREVAEISARSDRALDRRVPEPRAADEIGRLARTMNAMLERLDASRRRERRFVADAAHELRSPLANIRAELDVALTHPERADWPALCGSLLEQHDRLESLVENLLVLARADEGRLVPAGQVVDVDELVLQAGAPVRARGRVRLDLSGVAGGRVLGDRADLARVVQNLLDNAQRHAATTVRVEAAARDGAVQLAVEDDGPGIPSPDRARVFERFTRLDSGRSRGEGGAGLGLAIVREIVGAHRGTVEIASAVHAPSGTRVVVTLPALPAGGGAESAAPALL
jgi:signal transduction histidine kinase